MRNGKIARIPWKIREELNRRLQNAELAAPILDWLNSHPEVQHVLTTLFAGKRITKQNLCEWRYGGYQEWLRHQARQESIQRVVEQGYELEQREGGEEPFEAFCRILIAEWSTRIETLHTIRDPARRIAELQKITRDFVRLQTSASWSSRVRLEWVKYNGEFQSVGEEKPRLDPPDPEEPEPLPLTAPKPQEKAECKPSPTQSTQGEALIGDHTRPRVSCSAPRRTPQEEESQPEAAAEPSVDSSLVTHRLSLSVQPEPAVESVPEPPTDEPPGTELPTLNTKSSQLPDRTVDRGLRTLDSCPPSLNHQLSTINHQLPRTVDCDLSSKTR